VTDLTEPDATQPGAGAPPPSPATAGSDHRHLGWALALICTAQLMVVLDATIANIALPYIQKDLDFSAHALPWIITAYALTFGGLLLLGGKVGDMFGRRRAFVIGLTIFAVASLVGGFAQNEAMLLGSRAAQGLGAAFASPNALALINTTFDPGPKRSRAFAVYAMMSGVGAAVGLLLGGWLTGSNPSLFGTDIEGWRLTFLINVPIGAAAAIGALAVLAESDRHPGKLDVPGTFTATTGLLSLVYGITRAGDRSYGWGDQWTVTALVVGGVLLAAFVLIEMRVAQPMLPGRILANRDRAAAYVVMMLAPAAMFTMFFFLTLVIQNVMGESPMRTGLMFLPFSVVMVVWAVVVSRLVQKVNPGILAGVGGLVAATAVFGMSRMPYDEALAGGVGVDISYATDVLPWIMLMPVGMGLMFISNTMSVLHRVSPADGGIASGVLNTMQQVGGALGLATLATIAFNASDDKVSQLCRGLAAQGACAEGPTKDVLGVGFVHGATTGFLWCAVMLAVAGVISLAFNRIRHQDLGSHQDAAPAPAAPAH
jgi:EmrB/QacA subfamily drug resistance transporter